ncbi:hypothetical protein JTB14_027829 [Gonioctena quinquepunctata]|nr:hypothetical protein JTB14_027829 [Gonioctena quinquepunctata]
MKDVNIFSEAMVKKYNELSVDKYIPKVQTFLPLPDLKNEVSSLDELQNELTKNGHDCSVEVFQRKPLILMLKVKGTNCVVMGKGETREEASTDLFTSAIIMFNNGFSFRRNW